MKHISYDAWPHLVGRGLANSTVVRELLCQTGTPARHLLATGKSARPTELNTLLLDNYHVSTETIRMINRRYLTSILAVVLLAVVGSIIVGGLIFLPKVFDLLGFYI